MRLIDGDKLLEIYKKWIPQLLSKEDEGDRRGVETCIMVLEDAPTVDAVPVVDFMIANGVTVQDGKPLDAFLHPVDAYKGLKAKYLVFKADTGERVGNCFVLRPDKDPAAVEAIRAYARATDNETLAEDIYNWVGKGEPVQEWISVDDRLPDETGRYLVVKKRIAPDELGGNRTDIVILRFFVDDGFRMPTHIPDWINEEINEEITHWMPLPEPPKGE